MEQKKTDTVSYSPGGAKSMETFRAMAMAWTAKTVPQFQEDPQPMKMPIPETYPIVKQLKFQPIREDFQDLQDSSFQEDRMAQSSKNGYSNSKTNSNSNSKANSKTNSKTNSYSKTKQKQNNNSFSSYHTHSTETPSTYRNCSFHKGRVSDPYRDGLSSYYDYGDDEDGVSDVSKGRNSDPYKDDYSSYYGYEDHWEDVGVYEDDEKSESDVWCK